MRRRDDDLPPVSLDGRAAAGASVVMWLGFKLGSWVIGGNPSSALLPAFFYSFPGLAVLIYMADRTSLRRLEALIHAMRDPLERNELSLLLFHREMTTVGTAVRTCFGSLTIFMAAFSTLLWLGVRPHGTHAAWLNTQSFFSPPWDAVTSSSSLVWHVASTAYELVASSPQPSLLASVGLIILAVLLFVLGTAMALLLCPLYCALGTLLYWVPLYAYPLAYVTLAAARSTYYVSVLAAVAAGGREVAMPHRGPLGNAIANFSVRDVIELLLRARGLLQRFAEHGKAIVASMRGNGPGSLTAAGRPWAQVAARAAELGRVSDECSMCLEELGVQSRVPVLGVRELTVQRRVCLCDCNGAHLFHFECCERWESERRRWTPPEAPDMLPVVARVVPLLHRAHAEFRKFMGMTPPRDTACPFAPLPKGRARCVLCNTPRQVELVVLPPGRYTYPAPGAAPQETSAPAAGRAAEARSPGSAHRVATAVGGGAAVMPAPPRAAHVDAARAVELEVEEIAPARAAGAAAAGWERLMADVRELQAPAGGGPAPAPAAVAAAAGGHDDRLGGRRLRRRFVRDERDDE